MGTKWVIFVDVLTALSVVAIVVSYAYPNLTRQQATEIYVFDLFVVILLAADFYSRSRKSELPLPKFLIKHGYELPSMLPLVLFSTLEHEFLIGMIVRSIRLMGLFRIIHLFSKTITIFEGNRLMYVMAFALTSVFLGAFAEYIVESSIQGTKINTFGDALWWSIVTVTTVGYGDIYPVTTAGRIIASIIMVIGIMILGLFISTLGNSLIESKLAKIKDQNIPKIKVDNKTNNTVCDENLGNNDKSSREETKLIIKNKIDSLETLREDEFYMLIRLIITAYYKEKQEPPASIETKLMDNRQLKLIKRELL